METGRRICVGVITGAHGVRGQVRLRSFTSDPLSVFDYKPLTDEKGVRSFSLKAISVVKDTFIVAIDGVKDRNGADAMRGTKLFVSRDLLPPPDEGEYYDADLAGLFVRCDDPRGTGKVVALHDFGAGPFLEVTKDEGGTYMLPFTNDCVPVVDVVAGFVTAVIPDGWLDKAKPPEAGVDE